jgi:peptidoglycan/LPS O-acetylase OafA/YrhL
VTAVAREAVSAAARARVDLAPQFPVLDSLRAVGALAVLTTHTAFQAGAYTGNGVWGTLLSRLDVGVAIFFVLSGFLLSRPHIARAAVSAPPPAAGRYYWKRFVRIYPVYAVTVVIALTTIPENDDVGVGDWVRSLLMVDVYAEEGLPHGLTQMWSLAAEVAFYLILPLLMWAALGRRRSPDGRRLAVVLGVLSAISVAWHLGLADRVGEVVPGAVANWLPGYLIWFAVGIGLAHAHVAFQLRGVQSRPLRALVALSALPGTCWTLAGALMLVSATPLAGPTLLYLPTSAQSLTKNLLYALVGGIIVLTGIFTAPGRYRRVMSAEPLRHLGHISYSLFCIHLVPLSVVMQVAGYELFDGHGFEIWALTLVTSLIASELLYRFVEMPGMRLKNLGRRTPGDPASEATHASKATHTATTNS